MANDQVIRPERLAESPQDFWRAMQRIATGVVHTGGILYPTFRVVGVGDFQLANAHILERTNVGPGGLGCRAADTAESEAFELAVADDHVTVVLLSRPGYGSAYASRTVLRVMHVARGRWVALEAPCG